MSYELPKSRAGIEKCQDVAVWGTVVLLSLGFVTSMFVAPAYTVQNDGFGGTFVERGFNWQLFSIFVIGIVVMIGVGLVGMHLSRSLEQMQVEQREAARAQAVSVTASSERAQKS